MEKLMFSKSDELLHEFFKSLSTEEISQIGLMGGWAVHYTLKNKDVAHLESRDIDIFFDPTKIKPAIIEEKLEKMGFHRHSTFRWAKYFDSETEKELTIEQVRTHPSYNTSTIYFDIATPAKIAHTMPEPLLKKVFGKERQFIKIKGIEVMVPSQKVLIEMKLKSSPERTDTFKRTKDIADLFMLLKSHPEILTTKNGTDKKITQKFRGNVARFKGDGTTAGAAIMLKTDQNRLIELLEKI